MLLVFQDLVLGILLSLFLSLLFATAKAVSKPPQFHDQQNYAHHLFDESLERTSCAHDVQEEEKGGENVEGKVFDESPVRLKGDDYEDLVKKSEIFEEVFSRVIGLEDGFDETLDKVVSGDIASDLGKGRDFVEVMKKREISNEGVFRGVGLEEGFGEGRERLKLDEILIEGSVETIEFEEVKEVKIKSEIFGESISSGNKILKRDNYSELVKELENNKDNVSEVEDKDEEWLEDWEGIERTELEKQFGDAVVFVGSKKNVDCISSFDNEVKAKLYGLHKVVIEGACHAQQPMALKVSARAKWNAWHLLGDMSREVAMEQYIALLSKSLPEWKMRDCHVSSDV